MPSLKDKLRHDKFIAKAIKTRDKLRSRQSYKSDYKSYANYNGKVASGGKYYAILLHCHVLEKGMSHESPRKFGNKHTDIIIHLLPDVEADSFEAKYAIETLNSYLRVYETHGWTDDDNYRIVKNYLDSNNLLAAQEPSTIYEAYSQIKKKNSIDYYSFLKSRHSIRDYASKKISDDDYKKAVSMALLTPSACNRQMNKVYYVKSAAKREYLIGKIQGISGIDKSTVNLFVITYDQNALLGAHERNQGFLNSGLFAMNFVNGLHSLGIGSCLLQCGNPDREQTEIVAELGIPANERIAVFVAAGYYTERVKYLRSKRKNVDEMQKYL